ncbi:hypothetical protein [Mitsuaria sp. GD03876]|uniref:hypothetical protein n=1 Tax=Mitsuaria sp. GD03876 TaxID=2975399 RepID=UPI00244D43C9|nr:hypothetical protein [Mitsuaria sp. GD03876]MDH0868003.1 hypothetical protein [Mitsuaria sp. GD03876]
MIELEPHEIDMVFGGDHWGFEARQDPVALARSYMYANGGFWGSSYPSCTSNLEVQTRTVTSTSNGGLSCSTSGSFPFFNCTLTPTTTTTHTTAVTRTVNCSY